MQTKVKKVEVYLTEGLESDHRGELDSSSFDPGLCRIRIVDYGNGPSSDIKSVQQTLVHELYHCVQKTFGMENPVQDPNTKPNDWWSEGSAEYFANVFYPDTDPDHMQNYNPKRQLYKSRYTGSLFFQHLSNTFTPDIAIHNWVVARKDKISYTLQDEQRRLSSDNFITKAFPSFATQFTDGRIVYNNDQPVVSAIVDPKSDRPQLRYRDLTNTVSVLLKKKPGVYDVDILVRSWAIYEKLEVTLPSKRLISFTFKTLNVQDSDTVLQYRKSTDTTWKTATKGQSATLEGGCSQYLFLATSTLDTDTSEPFRVTLTFTVKKAPKGNGKRQDETEADPVPSESPEINPDVTPEEDTPRDVTVISTDDSEGPDDEGDDEEGDSCSTDKCIIGNWNLDIPSMQSFLSKRLIASGAATITNLAVTGSSTFNVTQDLSSTMDFNNLDISYDASVSGMSFRTVIDLTGSLVGIVKLGADDTFTWVDLKSEGMVKTSTMLEGFGEPIDLDISIDEQYGPSTHVRYICQEDMLQMEGYIDGKFTWAYAWARESVV